MLARCQGQFILTADRNNNWACASLQSVQWDRDSTRQDSHRIPYLLSVFRPDWIFGDRYSARTNIRLTDWYMRMLSVRIAVICMKHKPNYLFFDAWILLLSLVQGKFSRAAVSALIPLNGFTLCYLPGRPGVMDEVQGSSDKKKRNICIHPIKGSTKELWVSLNGNLLSHIWSS